MPATKKKRKTKSTAFDWALLRGTPKGKSVDVLVGDIASRKSWTHGWQSDDYDFPPDFENSPVGGTQTRRRAQWNQGG